MGKTASQSKTRTRRRAEVLKVQRELIAEALKIIRDMSIIPKDRIAAIVAASKIAHDIGDTDLQLTLQRLKNEREDTSLEKEKLKALKDLFADNNEDTELPNEEAL